MTLAVFFGCTFIAFGPALSLFLFTIARDPLRIIILIAGAFFWLVSLLLSSLIWFIAVKASDPRDEALQRGLLIFGVMFSVLLQEAFRFLYYKLLRKAIEGLVALSEDGCSPISIQQMAYGECHAGPRGGGYPGLMGFGRCLGWGDHGFGVSRPLCPGSGWRGLRPHERRLLHDQPPGGRAGTGHRGHPRGLAALLPDLSLHDHGVDLPAHLLGHPIFPRLREPALVGDRGRRRHAPCGVGVDVLEPAVRGQPGALLPADGRCCCLGLPALGGLCPEPASLSALFTEWSQPPAGILRPRRTLPSPPAPALPSVSAARSALASSAIHFLLEWGTPASPGGAGTATQLQHPADKWHWGWPAPLPLWGQLSLRDLALLAPSYPAWEESFLGLIPRNPLASPPGAEDAPLSPVPLGDTWGGGSSFARRRLGQG
ncbi:uncharacterized protein LOC121062009 isoform X1 [Cygnus olor]|uniref:uncharacterized protein LOC121062009 isoform X1 n=1 Tax=Cygnus olor TaxID=8869 RepID=UPI001ADDFFE6|nr:uncharacterized protein LOC121062009 isoform X1 [Cygnus olor]